MAIAFERIGHADVMDREMARIERCGQFLERGLLACAVPAFEQDDRTLAVHDLGPLEHGEPFLKSEKLRRCVAGERRPPFILR